MNPYAICTLFEKKYHYGLAVMTNSLYRNGYRGTIWAGYRGPLPPWAKGKTEQRDKVSCYQVVDDLTIAFVPLDTEEHLTNIKPDFMLQLWADHCPEAKGLFYFDPDIVIKGPWNYFTRWIDFGVALCEDVNSPVSRSHPLRHLWREYFHDYGIMVEAQDDQYVNGGFIGLTREHQGFLEEWQLIQRHMKKDIGRPQQIGLGEGRTYLFHMSDQDALNITKDHTQLPVSIVDKNGMDFTPGGYLMSHALGKNKPWGAHYILRLLRTGISPNTVHRLYWQYADGLLQPYSSAYIRWKKLDLYAAVLLARFIGTS